ncbi:MAG: hypothetical protein AMJ92_07085 [candidate division Zixibacteria bacterium SM23_81]|nr:MAG: hypothetical protein AMJ92_07085 [candidate division Zixibacteria bacterium SM23_81]
MLKELRNIFFTGLLVLTPIVVTIYVFYQLFLKIDGLLGGKLIELTGQRIPGMGFVAVILLILLAGVFARNFIGKKMIQLAEYIVNRIPLINRVYSAVQQLSQAFFSGKRAVFQKAVLIEFPKKGSYCIGFQTSETKGEIQRQTRKELLSVFLPTSPNPTSGYLLFIPKDKVHPLQMTIEEAVKLVISGGAVLPQDRVEFRGEEARVLGEEDGKTIES